MLEIKLSTIEYYFALVLIISTGIQIFFYLFFYLRVAIAKRKAPIPQKEIPVSVIICAKNEEQNLRKNLTLVLEQEYSNFEVIIVNDCSSDETEFVIKQLMSKYSHLRYTEIKEDPKFKHNKKLAVTIGIKAALHEHFIFIDADCKPNSKKWLSGIYQEFRDKKTIILGYGPYEEQEGLLDKLVRYDTFSIAVQYLSYAHAGIPYMGVGRNMAYTRSTYEQSSKFTKHYHIKSGDDDLFIAEVGSKENTGIAIHADTFTYSKQVASFNAWCSQKRRHLTTSGKYKFIHKLLLVLEPGSRLLFYILGALYFIFGFQEFFIVIVSLIGSRFLLQTIINKLNLNRLQEKKLLVYSLIFDFILPILLLGLHFQNRLFRKKHT